MNAKFVKIAGLGATLVVLASVCLVGLQAQQATTKPTANPIGTNWIGYLVVGKEDPIDQIARGPYPTTVRQVEIGLRSDGVVVWRSGPMVTTR
jgi:hypothetical protein